jgi:hypothetical protein
VKGDPETLAAGWSVGVNHAKRSAIRYINRFGRLNAPLHDRWSNEPAASGGAGGLLYLKYVVGNELSGARVYPPMPKKPPHTSLSCTADGPWITMHGNTGAVTINLREVMRGELFAASRDRKRIISEWLKARDGPMFRISPRRMCPSARGWGRG